MVVSSRLRPAVPVLRMAASIVCLRNVRVGKVTRFAQGPLAGK